MNQIRIACGLLCFLMLNGLAPISHVQAENWPGWRGVRGDGTITEINIPTRWDAKQNIAWKADVPYGGHASPVVWEDHVILVGSDSANQQRMLLVYSRKDGKLLWERVVETAPLERIHKLNSHASSTPVTDGKRIYVSFLDEKQMLIAAYDFEGNQLWQTEPGVFSSVHGYCSSPILFKDLVIINGDHDGDAYIVALEQETGKTVWKTPRENRTRSYCTPIIREIDGRTQMLLSGSKSIASYDPNDGKRQWIIDGPTEQFVASPCYAHGLLFITGGFPDKHIMAIDPTGAGNVTETSVRWHHLRQGVSYVPSPVVVGDYFLVASDNGFGTCFEAKTGKIAWYKRMGRHYSASLVGSKDYAFFLDDDGVMKVVKPGPEFEVIAENELNDACYASPAFSQGQFFIRSDTALYCIGKDSQSASK